VSAIGIDLRRTIDCHCATEAEKACFAESRGACTRQRGSVGASSFWHKTSFRSATKILTDRSGGVQSATQSETSTHQGRANRRSPHRPDRASDWAVDDVVSGRCRVLFIPGDTKPDLRIDATDWTELEGAVQKILRPFRAKPIPKPAETRETSEKVSSQLSAMLPVRQGVSNISEK